jgi:hypothetical protein
MQLAPPYGKLKAAKLLQKEKCSMKFPHPPKNKLNSESLLALPTREETRLKRQGMGVNFFLNSISISILI